MANNNGGQEKMKLYTAKITRSNSKSDGMEVSLERERKVGGDSGYPADTVLCSFHLRGGLAAKL